MSANLILLAHENPEYLERMVAALSDRDYHVVGPVRTARMALALAAQHAPRLALVGRRLAGQRDGASLAEALAARWGTRTILIDEPAFDALRL